MSSFGLSDLSLAIPGEWHEDAACRDADPNLFFASDDETRRAAMTLCSTCPVRRPCLEHALRTGETYGIWGGTDEGERKRLLRQGRSGRRAA
jgi:WhiB family transcriptional regulator, redox-sensing transcriptional regulator